MALVQSFVKLQVPRFLTRMALVQSFVKQQVPRSVTRMALVQSFVRQRVPRSLTQKVQAWQILKFETGVAMAIAVGPRERAKSRCQRDPHLDRYWWEGRGGGVGGGCQRPDSSSSRQ